MNNTTSPSLTAALEFVELNCPDNSLLKSLYQTSLFEPLEDFLSRPRKSFRLELIKMGYQLAFESLAPGVDLDQRKVENNLQLFGNVVELLHSGSLIIDDIEDQSKMRRGKETLHEIYGVPVALNAGSWLYFWPLVIIQKADISESLKQFAVTQCQETLLLAHTGQALDIGTKIENLPASEMQTVIFKIMELKSGALVSLAMKLGAMILIDGITSRNSNNDDSQKVLKAISTFGYHFGQLLQVYDDIGNLVSPKNPLKQYEDIKLMRPSYSWGLLAELCSPNELKLFQQRIQIESYEPSAINSYIDVILKEKDIINHAKIRAGKLKEQWTEQLTTNLPLLTENTKNQIHQILEKLTHAY